jgi:hypothetical protein
MSQKPKKHSKNCAFFIFGAGNEIRTRDPDLGKVVLYQLSYSRNVEAHFTKILEQCKSNLQLFVK